MIFVMNYSFDNSVFLYRKGDSSCSLMRWYLNANPIDFRSSRDKIKKRCDTIEEYKEIFSQDLTDSYTFFTLPEFDITDSREVIKNLPPELFL